MQSHTMLTSTTAFSTQGDDFVGVYVADDVKLFVPDRDSVGVADEVALGDGATAQVPLIGITV